ncbi:MAG: ParB/RepB/Spo0J family partition protein [Bacteroidales bacterium]|nr:ParB/RepB/Spo0J family partition protein [Bacteroidales bacterium]
MTEVKGKRRALGRGLDSILQSPDTDITSDDISGNYVAGAIAELEISKIETNPFQPRTDFDGMMLRELADSILAQGVIQPITVRKMGYDKYQLIAGERRLRASQLAGLERIPAFIRVANDEQMLELALIENIHRQELNAIEVAISYQRLIEECKLTQEKLSERIGKNRSSIANSLRLLKLPPSVQVALRDGFITTGHARALITVEDGELQENMLRMIINRGLNVRQVEEMVRTIDKGGAATKKTVKKAAPIPERFKETTAVISQKLGTKVSLKRNTKGQGSLVITFKNDSELETIIKVFNDQQ